ncbi:MAG TPA: DUF748 domain-containing protein, partial [Candidatus Binatia bacterium]|nr:DUF748 domain-containing protein [Candidatus Binatia bacterium]
MRRRRIAIGVAVVAAALAVLVLIVPGLLARVAAGRLSASLGTTVHVGWLAWNPFSGSWWLSGLRVAADRGPPALAARRVHARVSLWDVARGRNRVRLLTVDGARLRLRATPAGWELPLPPHDGGSASTAPTVAVDWAGAPRARIRLESAAGVRSLLRLRQLELTGTTAPEATQVAMWTRGRLDRGSLAFAGRIRATEAARRIRLRLAATGLDVARALRLAQVTAVRDLRGRVDVRARYDEAGDTSRVDRRVVGNMRLHDLALGTRGVDAIWLKDVNVPRFAIDVGRQAVDVGAVRVRGAEAWLRRGATENFGPDGTPAWSTTVAGVELGAAKLHLLDVPDGAPPLEVMVEEAHVGRVGAPDVPVAFSGVVAIGSGGRASAEGEVVRAPLAATVRTRLDDVALPPLLERVPSPLRLESGRTSGSVQVSLRDGALEGSGEIAISDVKSISPDPARPEDVMAFKDARLRLRRARTNPPAAEFEAVEIEWPYVLVDRSPDGIFPLTLASGKREAGFPVSVAIDAFRVLGARIDFRDTVLTPPYWRALANLRADARTIEAPALRIGSVEVAALVDEVSPLHVRGTVGTRTRLVADVERLALPPFNAYLEGASPYVVSSGLLSGRSEVVLARSQLEVNNRVVLSRLKLGGGSGNDLVQQEIGIPLTLALALMKDYRGDIALDLPFGGNLREPTFEMRSVVVQAILRAIRNAVLSPLNALARVFLKGERIERIEIDPVPFPPGARQPDEAGKARILQVARVLGTHPELLARLRGTVGTADLEHLRDEAALAALVAEPAAEPLRAVLRARLDGAPPPALSDADRARLETLLASLPWPGDALYDLALDRGAVAGAILILEHRIVPERVSPAEPSIPGAGAPLTET